MYSQQEIDNFVKEMAGLDDLKPGDDLMNDLGVIGDDFHELMAAYSKHFNVDMSTYLWYFHAKDEGAWTSIGSSFFRPPYQRVEYIPVTADSVARNGQQGSLGHSISPPQVAQATLGPSH